MFLTALTTLVTVFYAASDVSAQDPPQKLPGTEERLCDCGNDLYNYDEFWLFLSCICTHDQYDCCNCCKYI